MSRNLREFYFTLDLRSLALYRILLAGLLIWDALARWPDLEAFYTSFGALPADAELPKGGGEFHFCLLDGVTSLPMVHACFCVGLLFYFLFLVGYRTRLFNILSFVFFTSVVSRATLLRDGSVVVLATMLMWTMFLPMGRRFSLDSLLEQWRGGVLLSSPPNTDTQSLCVRSNPSFAALAIVGQLGLIYFFTACAKYGTTWKDGTALYYALNLDQLARPFGQWLTRQPLGLLKAFTWGTLVMEFAALPLFLLPVAQPWLRRVAIVGLSGLHLGIATMTTLAFFSLTMICSYALLLLPEDWAWLQTLPALRRAGRFCHFAKSWAGGAFSWWFGPADVQTINRIPENQTPKSSGRGFLREGFGRRISGYALSTLVSLLFVTFTVDAYNLNLSKRLGERRIPEPQWMRAIILVPLIPHDWELFAPNPTKDDGWWVIDGETESGRALDPFTGRPPTFDKPADLAYRFDRYWRKYLSRIWLKKNYNYRLYFGKYITRRNHRASPPGERLAHFNFFFVKELTQPPGTPQPWPTERVLLWHHECFRSAGPVKSEEPDPGED